MARKIQFVEGEYYHIFNRGVEKRTIVEDEEDLEYFLDNLLLFNTTANIGLSNGTKTRKQAKELVKFSDRLVEIVAYALLPNHFHLLLKEIRPGGISKFMQKLGTSFPMFFNEKYERSGSLFQGTFKATEVSDLLAVSAYINLNFIHHGYNPKKDLVETSYFEYVEPEAVNEPICSRKEIENIINISGGVKKYISDAQSWSEVFVESHKDDKGFNL